VRLRLRETSHAEGQLLLIVGVVKSGPTHTQRFRGDYTDRESPPFPPAEANCAKPAGPFHV
jgi:hypothetical protein